MRSRFFQAPLYISGVCSGVCWRGFVDAVGDAPWPCSMKNERRKAIRASFSLAAGCHTCRPGQGEGAVEALMCFMLLLNAIEKGVHHFGATLCGPLPGTAKKGNAKASFRTALKRERGRSPFQFVGDHSLFD